MTSGFPYLLCFVCTIIESTSSQYISGKKSNKVCEDGANKTYLVEHFFNVIFNEFHSSPPVCICVQMCDDQPTYCYPNGCLKRIDSKKQSSDDLRPPVTHIQHDGSSKTFLVDERNDFTHVLNHPDDKKDAPKQTAATREYFSDPLKDIYNSLFKYKKLPRVELRYNLREQVKNMKSDVFKLETDDVSKTRWPKTHHKIFHDQKLYTNVKSLDLGNANLFLSSPKYGTDSYTSRYFKRDLRRSKPFENGNDLMDIEEKSDITDEIFSIGTLIDNLVGNTFDGANNSNIELKVSNEDKRSDLSNVENITKNSNNEPSYKKEKMCVESMNLTNDIKHESKVDDKIVSEVVRKRTNYTFNEMMAAMSKQIDLQNNTSMEMMKRSTDSSAMKKKAYQNRTNMSSTELTDKSISKLIIKDSDDTTYKDNTNSRVILGNSNGTAGNVK